MYDLTLELLYNKHISYFSQKSLNDQITSHILNNFDSSKFCLDIYSKLNKVFDNKHIIKGGLLVQHLINENLSGDLDLEINIQKDKFYQFISNKESPFYTLENIFSLNEIKQILNTINLCLDKYFTTIYNITRNIDFIKILPEESLYNNSYYLFKAYNKKIVQIKSRNYINYNTFIDRNVKYSVSIIKTDFLLVRFYLDVLVTSNDFSFTTFTPTINKEKSIFKSKFLFLDISLVPDKDIRVNKMRILNNYINIYPIRNIISDQLITLLSSFITNNKIYKRSKRVKKLLKKYKTIINIKNTKVNPSPIHDDKILFSKLNYIFNNEYPMDNFYTFKRYVLNDKFIYLPSDISYHITTDSNLLDNTPEDYIKDKVLDFINYIDFQIKDIGGNKDNILITDNIERKKLISLFVKLFNLSKYEYEELVKDEKVFNHYYELYNIVKK